MLSTDQILQNRKCLFSVYTVWSGVWYQIVISTATKISLLHAEIKKEMAKVIKLGYVSTSSYLTLDISHTHESF